MPEHARVFFDPIAAGAARAGRALGDLDLQAGGVAAFSDDLERLVARRKPGLAFTLGAMGSRQHNFYNDALVLQTNLLGTEAMVRDRIRAYRSAGVTTLRVEPEGETLDSRLATLGRVVELVREVSAEPNPHVPSPAARRSR